MGKDSRERSSALSLESGLQPVPESSPVPGQLRPVPDLSPPPNSSSLLPLQLPNTRHPRSKPPACPNPRKKKSSSLSLQSGRDRPVKRRSSAVSGQLRPLPDPPPPGNSSSLSSPQLLFTDHPQTKSFSPSKSTRHTAYPAAQDLRSKLHPESPSLSGRSKHLSDEPPPPSGSQAPPLQLHFRPPQGSSTPAASSPPRTAALSSSVKQFPGSSHGSPLLPPDGQRAQPSGEPPQASIPCSPFCPKALASEIVSTFISCSKRELDQDQSSYLVKFFVCYLQSSSFSLLSEGQRLLWTTNSRWRCLMPEYLLAPRPLSENLHNLLDLFSDLEQETLVAIWRFRPPVTFASSPATTPPSSPVPSPPPSPTAGATSLPCMDQQSKLDSSSPPFPKDFSAATSSPGRAFPAVPPAVLAPSHVISQPSCPSSSPSRDRTAVPSFSPPFLNIQTSLSPPNSPHQNTPAPSPPPTSSPPKKFSFRHIPPPHNGKGILPIPTPSPYHSSSPLFFPLHSATPAHLPAHRSIPPPHTGKGILPNPVCFLPSFFPFPAPLYIPFSPPYPASYLWLVPIFPLVRLLDPASPPTHRRRRRRKGRQRSKRSAPRPATTTSPLSPPPPPPLSRPPQPPATTSPVPSLFAIPTPLPSTDVISSPSVASFSTLQTSRASPSPSAQSPSVIVHQSPPLRVQTSAVAQSPTAVSRPSAQSSSAARPPSAGSRPFTASGPSPLTFSEEVSGRIVADLVASAPRRLGTGPSRHTPPQTRSRSRLH